MSRTEIAPYTLPESDSADDSEIHPRRHRSRSPRRHRSRSPRRHRSRSPRRQECDCHPRRQCDGVQCIEVREQRLLEREEEEADKIVVGITSFKIGFNHEMMKSTDLDEAKENSVEPEVEPEIEPAIEQSLTITSRCVCEGPGPCGGRHFGATWGHSTGATFSCPGLMREYVRGL